MFSLLRKLFKNEVVSILSFQDNHNKERKTCELVCIKVTCLLLGSELFTIKKVKFYLFTLKQVINFFTHFFKYNS